VRRLPGPDKEVIDIAMADVDDAPTAGVTQPSTSISKILRSYKLY